MQLGYFDEPKRKPIKISVKKEVYKRAKGGCESCGKKLPFTGGATCYHHRRTPTISPTAKTVQLLCQNCHAEHGHKRKTVTRSGLLYEEKETVVKRKKVRRKVTSKKKKTTKKKTTRKKRTIKKKSKKKKTPRKKPVKKKKTTRKKTTRKKRTTKKKTTKGKKKTTKRKTKRRK